MLKRYYWIIGISLCLVAIWMVLPNGVLPNNVLPNGVLPNDVLPNGVLPNTVVYPILKMTDNVLTPNECKDIIEIGTKVIQPSMVGFDRKINHSHRNSSHGWLSSDSHPALLRTSIMLENLTGYPRQNQEQFQIVKYQPGQYYKYHLDSCNPDASDYEQCIASARESGFRIYTFIIYLNDDYKGGATHFNKINKYVKGKTGQGVYFRNLKSNNVDSEPLSEHAGTEVEEGTKWIINCWIRTKKFIKK